MAPKIVLIVSCLAQIAAAGLAFRLNRRYPLYSAWLLISAAACMTAILQLATLADIWWFDFGQQTAQETYLMWSRSLSSLLVSTCFLAGIALIEPLFQQLSRFQELLKYENRQLASMVQETEDEMRLARKIQQDLLPARAPELCGFELAGVSRPAVWTSGDYFDYLTFRDGTTGLIVADASGHGTGPALLMSSARASIRALVATCDDLGELLQRANNAFSADAQDGRFLTAFVAAVDPGKRQFVYASAGHPGYLLKADGTGEVLRSESPPLGAVPGLGFNTHPARKFQPGDILVLVTDGILEARDESGEQFGELRLFDVVAAHRQESAERIVDAIFETSRRFAEGPRVDDHTAVVLKAL